MPILEITTPQDFLVPTPIWFGLPARRPSGGLLLKGRDGAPTLPIQVHGDRAVTVVQEVRAGKPLRFELTSGPRVGGVAVSDAGPHELAISLPEGPFTVYNTDPKIARPFCYPLNGPGGKGVTRGYPMKDIAGEARDHPHHRSFWTAYGEVNGVDDWSEAPGKHGFIRHQKFEERVSGPVFGGFRAAAVWTAPTGSPLLDEKRQLRVYNLGADLRMFDYDVWLTAAHGPVHYGDTKEGGILAVRVATPMDGNKHGRMENSLGAAGEKDIWGKRAAWLDYSGPPEGPGTPILGIAMMDHPGNLAHPCAWHARDYGLVGTNPFARKSFDRNAPGDGYHQKAGETLHFRYRVAIHRGNAREGRVDSLYHAWVAGPKAAWIDG